MKDRIDQRVTAAADTLIGLSQSIHAEPELSFAEHRSAAKVAQVLREAGFEVTEGAYDLPTALSATYGSGDLVVGVCAEYDALPEIGHACGHNVIAASSVGAALGLAAVADELGLTVKLLGTPAEEGGGGKQLMLERGAFDDVTVAMMAHPSPVDIATADFGSKAAAQVEVVYRGKEAHASAAPHLGINALDATTVAQVALGLLRQHLLPGGQLHAVIHEGGLRPNVVPALARMGFTYRADTLEDLLAIEARVRACFEAGALATGATMEFAKTSPDYADLRPDAWMTAAYRAGLIELGRELPVIPGLFKGGSTDMGNVSHALPSIHPALGIDPVGFAMPHTPEFATAAATPRADRAVLDGAKALARTAAALATDQAQRAAVLEAHAARRSER